MRQITGRDEVDFCDGTGPAGRLAGLFAALSGREARALRRMSLAEWEEALLGLHVRVFGPRVQAELDCPACGAGVLVVFEAGALPREAPAVPAVPLAVAPLTLGDLLDLEAEGATGETALGFLLGRAAKIGEAEAAAALAGSGWAALEAGLEAAAAGLGIELGTRCADCGAAIMAPFDVAAFVDAEVLARAVRLLDEVHILATAYHWAEAAILRLPHARRQAYLARILADPARAMGAVA